MGQYLDIVNKTLESKKTFKQQKCQMIRDMLKDLNTRYPVSVFEFVVNSPELLEELNSLETEIHRTCIDDYIAPESFRNEQLKKYTELHRRAYEEIKKEFA